jgi:outer membrane protein TolC
VLQGRELVAAEAERVDRLGQIVARLRRQVDEGYAPRAELMRFRSEETLATLRRERSQIELYRATARLEALLGLPLEQRPLAPPAPLAAVPGDPARLAQQVLASHPGLPAARARHAVARGQLAVERAQRNPDLALAAGWKRTAGEDTGVVGLVVSLPLFDRNGRGVAEATAAERAAELEATWLEESLSAELVVLVRAARVLEERASEVEEQLLVPATEARDAILSAFREGRSDALALLDAERVFADAQREALSLRGAAFTAAYEVRLLTGQEEAP